MLRSFFIILFALAASEVVADDYLPSIEVEGASRDKVKNELVMQLTKKGEFRLVEETYFRLVFEQDAESLDKKPLYQTSEPLNRYTFTVTDTDRAIQLSADIQLLENNGTPFERRTTIRSGKAAQASQTILTSIKESFASARDNATLVAKTASPPPEEEPHRRPYAAKSTQTASAQSQAIKTPPRLGFSAATSSDKGNQGFVITAVDPKTPAAKAGLQPSDVVLAIDGQPVATDQEMETARAQLVKHRQAKMKVLRDGKTYEASLRF